MFKIFIIFFMFVSFTVSAQSFNKKTNKYPDPEVDKKLREGFDNYEFMVENNIFSNIRGKKEVIKIEPPKVVITPTIPQPIEKSYYLVGVVSEDGHLYAYIERVNENNSYIMPISVNEKISNELGIIKSICMDSIEYVGRNNDVIKIVLGADLTGELRKNSLVPTANTMEDMMKIRRNSQNNGFNFPMAPINPIGSLNGIKTPQNENIEKPAGMSNEEFMIYRRKMLSGEK